MSHAMPLFPSSSNATDRASHFSSASESTPIVFVVDDDASVRESLELLIDSAGWHAQTFACAMEFLASPRSSSPSCLVLDVSLPDFNGLDVQERIAADRVDTPIIFITGYGDVPLDAIAKALERSRTILSDEAEMRVLRERQASLSHRECEVMALVVAGR